MSVHIGNFDSAEGSWDEDGFTLYVGGTDGEFRVRVDTSDLAAFDTALESLREWRAEGERERAAYLRATPAERAEVLGPALDDDGAELDYAEVMRDNADHSRKARRENA